MKVLFIFQVNRPKIISISEKTSKIPTVYIKNRLKKSSNISEEFIEKVTAFQKSIYKNLQPSQESFEKETTSKETIEKHTKFEESKENSVHSPTSHESTKYYHLYPKTLEK